MPGRLPAGGVVVAGDAEARAVVEDARRAGRPPPPLGLLGGDLCRTLGGPGDRSRLTSEDAVQFSVDLGSVLVDGRLHWFVSHLVSHRALWGEGLVAMNAQWRGHWNLGPRAHPGDGLLDVYQFRLGPADRFKVRARLHHGVHLPHPGITENRTAAVQVSFERPRRVWLDGAAIGRCRALSLRVEPDALTVVV